MILKWYLSSTSFFLYDLFNFLEGLMSFLCYNSHCFQDTLYQTRRTEIFKVRPILNFFDSQSNYSKKSSCQSFGSIYVVSILERLVLRMHTALKSLRHNFEQYICYISAPV